MNYTQISDKTQVFSAFSAMEACKSAVNDKKNAGLLFDFNNFCRLADPLFSAVWGDAWFTSAAVFMYGHIFKNGEKIPANPHSHSFENWPSCRNGFSAGQMIEAICKGENYIDFKTGPGRAKYITLLTDRLAVIDIDRHDAAAPDQREDLLNGLNYLKIAAIAEPTSAGLHVFFMPTDGVNSYIMGSCQAQDNSGRPIRLEIIANSYKPEAGKYIGAHAVMLGCGRVENYAMTAQQLTARLCVPGAQFSPIPPCLIPEKNEAEKTAQLKPTYSQPQPAAPAAYNSLQPVGAVLNPAPAPAPAPSCSQFPDLTLAQAGYSPQPVQPVPALSFTAAPSAAAAAPVPPPAAPAAYQTGIRNTALFNRLKDVAKDIIYGDNALYLLRAAAQVEYAAMPDKQSFSPQEVENTVQSVYRQLEKDSSRAAERRQAAELKKLCRVPKKAVKWAAEQIGLQAVRYNEMTRQIEGEKPIDSMVTDIYNCLQRNLTRPEIEAELLYSADQTTYHPVRTWLESLPPTDDKSEVMKLCDLLNVDSLGQAYIYHWLAEAVCCLYNGQDGQYFPADGVLVLQGRQGAGKTSLLRHLAVKPDWWISGAKIDNDKDNAKRILTRWIAELGEIGSTMRKDQDSLKAFVSCERDAYRLPFARHDIQAPRQTALCGSVNEAEFLSDPTGARRWWVIPTPDKMDREKILGIDTAKLWGSIYTFVQREHAKGRSYADIYQLPETLKDVSAAASEAYRKKTAAEIDLYDLLIMDPDIGADRLNWKTANELTQDLPWTGTIKPNVQQVARALTALNVPCRIIGGRRKVYGVAVSKQIARAIDMIAIQSNKPMPAYKAVPADDSQNKGV